MSTVIIFPLREMGKIARYPFGRKVWPSKALREFDFGDKVGEPKVSQQVVDITQVEAPSSMIVQWIGLPFDTTYTWNASWCERQGLDFSMSKIASIESLGSIPQMAESKAFLYAGQSCNTSRADISDGAFAKSSTML